VAFKFLAIDPGSKKCGLAVMTSDGETLEKLSATAESVGDAAAALAGRHPGMDRVVIGSGTGSAGAVKKLKSMAGLPAKIETSAERNTTLDARRIYDSENPSRWPMGLFFRWLLAPPKSVDDYAAVAIGRKYLERFKEE
jgi:RNase H-fold protein (predicted Holliday junction resolvase)